MSGTHHVLHRAPAERVATPWLTRAWTAVALIPVFFLVAFAAGEGLYALLGYEAGQNDEPLWVVLLGTVVVLAVCLLPCAAAAYAGRRAGGRRGRLPAALGLLVAAGLTILTLVSTIGDLVRR